MKPPPPDGDFRRNRAPCFPLTVSPPAEKMPRMTTLIDYTSRKFKDDLGRRYLLQFRTDETCSGDPRPVNPTGQIVATVMNFGGDGHGSRKTVSREHIRFNDAEAAFDRDHLPYLEPDLCDLAVIMQRLVATGLAAP